MFYLEIILFMVMGLMLILCVLVSVAFLTLLERKLLGYIQNRKGPNKVSVWGVAQPFSDAIKLFTSEQTYPLMSNYIFYYISPIISLFLSLIIWVCMPFMIQFFNFNLGLLFFMSCLSLGVYTIMVSGWSSNSNYAMLGSLRSIAQTISYEVSLALILMSFIFLIMNYNMINFYYYQKFLWFIVFLFPLSVIWLIISLAETNRTPFDFAEGESELVSGFNIEYSGGSFSLIFLAEYSSILFMSMMFSLMFLGGNMFSFFFYLKLLFISFMFIWLRGTLPRFRYDKLMYLAWKIFLPLSLNYLMFFLGVKLYLLYYI
nr:NADH dehydrogenase subunit 1 [Serichlamys sp. ECU1]